MICWKVGFGRTWMLHGAARRLGKGILLCLDGQSARAHGQPKHHQGRGQRRETDSGYPQTQSLLTPKILKNRRSFLSSLHAGPWEWPQASRGESP